MKQWMVVALVFIASIGFISCEKQSKIVEENAYAVENAFADEDIGAINEAIFGTYEFDAQGKLADMWKENIESQEGILENIFEYVTVEVEEITRSTITYEIKAPDMKDVFVECGANMTEISEEVLLQHIRSYAKQAEKKVTTVTLAYLFVDDDLVVDYQNEAFINAVTGGLLDAYKALYEEMMNEYMKGIG